MRHAQGIIVVVCYHVSLRVRTTWGMTHALDISMARTLLIRIAQATFTRILILHENIYPKCVVKLFAKLSNSSLSV